MEFNKLIWGGLLLWTQSLPAQTPALLNYSTSRFTLQYPEGWEADSSGKMGTSLILFSPIEGDDDHFRENINLLSEKSTTATSLEEYSGQVKKILETMVTDATIIRSEKAGDHWRMEYTGKQGKLNLYYLQYYFLKDGTYWILTFTTTPDEKAKHLTAGEAILNTFSLR